MKNNMSLKKQVESILRDYPKARDDDKYLVLSIWAIYYEKFLFEHGDHKAVVLRNILSLPSTETIGRIRRKFQEEGLYPPSVAKQNARRAREEVMREEMRKSSQEILL